MPRFLFLNIISPRSVTTMLRFLSALVMVLNDNKYFQSAFNVRFTSNRFIKPITLRKSIDRELVSYTKSKAFTPNSFIMLPLISCPMSFITQTPVNVLFLNWSEKLYSTRSLFSKRKSVSGGINSCSLADAKRFANRSKTSFYPGCQNILPYIGLAEETRLLPALDDFSRYIFRIGFIY